jgi:heptaprenyl diphosphate synthase
LANAATLLALELAGPGAAVTVAVLRPVFGGVVSGGLLSTGFFLGLSGAVVSALVMAGLWRLAGPGVPPVSAAGRSPATGGGGSGDRLSLVGVSLAGGVAHNLGQLAAAVVYVGPAAAVAYVGPLTVAGLVSGYIVGRLASVAARAAAVRTVFRQMADRPLVAVTGRGGTDRCSAG